MRNLILAFLLTSCGAVQKAIDQSKEIDKMAEEADAKAAADAEKNKTITGSRTKTVSTTETISKSGDQSVFDDEDETSNNNGASSAPVPKAATLTLVGTWASDCHQGIAYMQTFTAPTQKQAGLEIKTTNIYDADCEFLHDSYTQKIVYSPIDFVFIDANTMQNAGVTFRRIGE